MKHAEMEVWGNRCGSTDVPKSAWENGARNALRGGQDGEEVTNKYEESHSRPRDHHTQKPENKRGLGLF